MVTETEISIPGGKLEVLNLNRSRQRSVYYRPDGTATLPLPSDPFSMAYYQKKGFTLKPEIKKTDTIACPVCGFEAKDVFGLQSHLRVHVNKSKKEKE